MHIVCIDDLCTTLCVNDIDLCKRYLLCTVLTVHKRYLLHRSISFTHKVGGRHAAGKLSVVAFDEVSLCVEIDASA
jgi:hypothetical protein